MIIQIFFCEGNSFEKSTEKKIVKELEKNYLLTKSNYQLSRAFPDQLLCCIEVHLCCVYCGIPADISTVLMEVYFPIAVKFF